MANLVNSVITTQEQAYLKEDRQVRQSRLKYAALIGIVAMPTGFGLELAVYPEMFIEFMGVRLFTTLLLFILYGIVRTDFGYKHAIKLGFVWAFIITTSLDYMIFRTEGVASPYYAGLNLVILGLGVLLPWSFRETLAVTFGIYLVYLVACASHWLVTAMPILPKDLFLSSFFILVTGGISAVSSMVTSRARRADFYLKQELDDQNRKLQELDQLKSQFFANISHELRTPLTLVYSPVEQILQKYESLPGPVHEHLVTVHRNALRLLKLINEILDVMKLDQGMMQLNKQPIKLDEYIGGLVNSVQHLGSAKQLKFKLGGSNPDLDIIADRDRMEKVILNLLTNAIKFSHPGGVIQVKWFEASGGVRIDVVDQGVGIPEDKAERVFDRFSQVDTSSTRKAQGVGLGLALAKEITELHGGNLTFESEYGKGTTFSILLPQTEIESPVTESSELKEETTGVAGAETSPEPYTEAFKAADRFMPSEDHHMGDELPEVGKTGKSVLVVDDEPDMRRFIVQSLKQDFRIIQAIDGVEALKQVKSQKPDLVVLDWMLPEMDGIEVCKQIKADETLLDTKVIMLTARSDEQSKLEGLESGADDFLTKPFSSLELIARIRVALNLRELQDALRDRNVELQETLAELKEAESKLVHHEKMAAMGELSAGILHEINNPLNAMVTALSFGLRSKLVEDEKVMDLLTDLKEGADRIQGITTDLRTFAHPETLNNLESFSLGELFESTINMLSHKAQGVDIKATEGTDLIVEAAKGQISQVLVNLVSNAIDALNSCDDPQNPSVIMYGKQSGSDENAIEVGVIDNADGMPDDVLNRIFEPFYTTKDISEGMGLGLSISHTIVKTHSSELKVETELGKGSRFYFELPAYMTSRRETLIEN